jgi:acetoin utilization deacetylase AcuC-like enzyme
MALFYYDPLVLKHDTGNHPERAERIILAARRATALASEKQCQRPVWKPIGLDELRLVHRAEYIDSVRDACRQPGTRLDPDTVVCPESFEIGRVAAGAVVDAVERLITGEQRRAFCLIRPPGHHALVDRAMGFCLFNNVALAARVAIERFQVNRVLIVDWDVHHGNGTQDIFWDEPRVGFFSIHRHPFYPGTGLADETGGDRAQGTKKNVPVAFGTRRDDYRKMFQQALEKIAERMRPELVIVSAGFDAHRLDPIGSLELEADDFGPLTQQVLEVARTHAQGRILSVMEGGYHPEAVADCIDVHLKEFWNE